MKQNVKNQNIQYNIKTIIIKDKYKTGKKLLNYIIKEKYKNNINFIKITQDNFKLLDQEHLIIKWTENYPGAIYYHTTVAGLPIKII